MIVSQASVWCRRQEKHRDDNLYSGKRGVTDNLFARSACVDFLIIGVK